MQTPHRSLNGSLTGLLDHSVKRGVILIIATLLLTLTTLISAGCAGESNIRTRTHVDEGRGYQIDFPVEWQRAPVRRDPTGRTTQIAFSAPATGDSDGGAAGDSAGETASVTLIVERLDASDDITLEEYSERELAQLPKVVQGMKRFKHGNTRMDGSPARHIEYSGRLGDHNPRWRQVWTITYGRVFILTYVGIGKAFDKHEDTYETMLASIKFFEPVGSAAAEEADDQGKKRAGD